jgi:ankyrin repeat protein
VAVAAALVGAGADTAATGRWGWTALHHAAAGGSGAMVRWLLNAGASVGAADAFGSKPLHVAAEQGGVEAISVLCAGGGSSCWPRARRPVAVTECGGGSGCGAADGAV